jgi:anti-sigma B factor antagonist
MGVRGRLNMNTAPVFLERMTQLVESGRRQIIVDLGEVDLVDSSGIGALINSTRQLRQHGGDLRLARPNRRMQVLLDVTYLHDLFRTYDDVDKALIDT